MSSGDNLQGNTPMQTARELLLELKDEITGARSDIAEVKSEVAIIRSQDLGPRVRRLEDFRNQLVGLSWAGALLGLIGTLIGIISLIISATSAGQVPA